MTPRTTWILTEGLAGTEGPCLGLARALGVEPVVRRVRIRQPWRSLPAGLWLSPFSAVEPGGAAIAPPWPDLVISSGSAVAPLAAAIRRAAGGATRVVHVQDPKTDPARFDLVVAPRHDGVEGANVVATRATLHGLAPASLAAAAEEWAPRLAGLGRPLLAFLCGGDAGRRFRLSPARLGEICAGIRLRMHRDGIGVAATPSRRTGPANEAVLHAELDPAGAMVWDGTGPNPYRGLLALADIVAVTQDSVSMISEAAGTGKPVYWIPVECRSRRMQRFVDALTEEGVLRRWPGGDAPLERWSYAPPDDTTRAAAEIRRRFGWG